MTHGDLGRQPAGPAGTGPQERKADLLPPDLPPGTVHYEPTDVTVRPVMKSIVALVVGTGLVVVLLFPVFILFRNSLARDLGVLR